MKDFKKNILFSSFSKLPINCSFENPKCVNSSLNDTDVKVIKYVSLLLLWLAWIFKSKICVRGCQREKERERVCVCVWVCMRELAYEREERERDYSANGLQGLTLLSILKSAS